MCVSRDINQTFFGEQKKATWSQTWQVDEGT